MPDSGGTQLKFQPANAANRMSFNFEEKAEGAAELQKHFTSSVCQLLITVRYATEVGEQGESLMTSATGKLFQHFDCMLVEESANFTQGREWMSRSDSSLTLQTEVER